MQFEKLDMKTVNFTDENIAKIAEIFPNVVSENGSGKVIDFEALKQELSGNIVEGYKERYSLNWPGKRQAQLSANTPTTKTLRPCKEESVDFDTTENLYIEGDNLEVLKILQESYLNKIKMIYIDPPYNTGKDFVYKDNFTRSVDEELEESGQMNEEGGRLVANLDSNGRYHSDWLSMMYPRLKLARNLLKDDGVIFLSIDDNEVHNLRKICDEVFGEDNFITELVWRKKAGGSNNAKQIAGEHEYLITYIKSDKNQEWFEDFDEKYLKRYSEEDDIGRFFWDTLSRSTGSGKQYPITTPDGTVLEFDENGNRRRWLWAENTFYKKLEEGEVGFKKIGDTWSVRFKQRLSAGKKPRSLLIDKGTTADGTSELKGLFKTQYVFDNPKPTKLIKSIINFVSRNEEDIILDFFSGSATTADSVMKLNSEDGLDRKFIMVQLPEETDEKSEAYKAGYKTIPEIGKERIRRAGKKIVEESGKTDLDIGFRVLKLDSSNMKDIYFNPSEISQANLFDTVDNIKDERSDLDLLFGVLIDWGVDLTLPIVKENIAGRDCYFVDEDSLCACFAKDINQEFIKELASREMLRVVFRDSGFASDDVKDNVSQIFKQLNPTVEIKVI